MNFSWILEYLWLDLTSKRDCPSKNHVNCGGGEPVAEHLKETCGPGFITCSMKVYCSSGRVSVIITIILTEVTMQKVILNIMDSSPTSSVWHLLSDFKKFMCYKGLLLLSEQVKQI